MGYIKKKCLKYYKNKKKYIKIIQKQIEKRKIKSKIGGKIKDKVES